MTTPTASLDFLLARCNKISWSPKWNASARWLEQQSTTILQHLEPASSDNPGHALIDLYHIAEFPSDGGETKPTPPVMLYGRDNYMRFRAKLAYANPGICLEVVDAVSNLDEDAGKASVYLTCRLLHYTPIDMKPRESVVMMEWARKRGDRWICIKSKVVHGYSHLPMFSGESGVARGLASEKCKSISTPNCGDPETLGSIHGSSNVQSKNPRPSCERLENTQEPPRITSEDVDRPFEASRKFQKPCMSGLVPLLP